MSSQHKGLTLIEVIIVMGILSILVMLSLPSYQNHLRQVRRTDATIALMDLANRMEHYYIANNNSFAGAELTTNLGLSSTTSAQGYYALSIIAVSPQTYTLQAKPITGTTQVDDSNCGSFTLTQSGHKKITGPGKVSTCWGS